MTKQPKPRARGEERRQAIVDAARTRAANGGWSSVTTRALSDDIGFTQPVLYSHFAGGKADIVLAVALEGFVQMANEVDAAVGVLKGAPAVRAAAKAYLEFARLQPAVYEAMFSLPIGVEFGTERTGPEQRAAFAALLAVFGDGDDAVADAEVVTEVFWSTLHGVSTLDAAGRLPYDAREARLAVIAERFS
ncbi:TetR/AcrR family transcriptional regulator [Humibacter sp. RRB41]|uniref:TetR/AcrR family transcriptional regulator n=1 Tax=Humibacter sp. RRB41 TaxID=2919946 RepID=UPI001FAB1009|nr:TetR/AcrR family transcriptional regulator [Humibacter sp. RRB41]